MPHQHEHTGDNQPGIRNLIPWIFLGIILFFLLSEHRAHFFGFLPYLLLLACPLMHIFMHRDHGGHGHRHNDDDSSTEHQHHSGCGGGTGQKASPEEKGDKP